MERVGENGPVLCQFVLIGIVRNQEALTQRKRIHHSESCWLVNFKVWSQIPVRNCAFKTSTLKKMSASVFTFSGSIDGLSVWIHSADFYCYFVFLPGCSDLLALTFIFSFRSFIFQNPHHTLSWKLRFVSLKITRWISGIGFKVVAFILNSFPCFGFRLFIF